jgi:Ca2+-binding EF-hand superfamily protein
VADDPPRADPHCEDGAGKGKHKGRHGHRFQRADKNGDGYLTQAEVGGERWKRIAIADADRDGKISKPELRQAFKDGKIERRGKGKKDPKAARS